MTRRALLMAACAAPVLADSATSAWNVIADAANALGQGNVAEFIAAFDKAMPGYAGLREDVTGLVRQDSVESSLDMVENNGNDAERTMELDWLLVLKPSAGGANPARRRQTVKCRVARQGRKWRVVEFEPLDFFRAPAV